MLETKNTMPDFAYGDKLAYHSKIELQKALAHTAVVHSILHDSEEWKRLQIKDLVPSLKLINLSWAGFNPDRINLTT